MSHECSEDQGVAPHQCPQNWYEPENSIALPSENEREMARSGCSRWHKAICVSGAGGQEEEKTEVLLRDASTSLDYCAQDCGSTIFQSNGSTRLLFDSFSQSL